MSSRKGKDETETSVVVDFHGNMDVLEGYYGKQTFTLYALFGSVPGKRVWPRVIFVLFSIVLLIIATIYQVVKLVIERFKLEYVIDLLPSTTVMMTLLLYVPYAAYIADEDYKVLLSIMLSDLREARTSDEDEIKRRYAEAAKKFTYACTAIFATATIGMSLSGFVPCLLDFVLPTNETRGVQFLVNGEIFIDQERYFTLIYFTEVCTVFVAFAVVGVSENMSVIIGQHACGMFAVVGHRLENITNVEGSRMLEKIDYAHFVTRRLHVCVKGHQRSLQFALLIAAFYDIPLTLVLTTTYCALTVSLVQVTDTQLISTRTVLLTVALVFQLFLVSSMGQNVTDASDALLISAYSAKWDACPPNVRRLLQMMILRSSKPCQIVARNIYTLSIENFMTVIHTVTSFYMVVRQAR